MKCMMVQLLASKCSQTVESVTEFLTAAKTLHQRFGANFKKTIFCKILLQICYFFAFFQLFSKKHAENDFFDQRLGCAAPKCWSKYSTIHQIYIL